MFRQGARFHSTGYADSFDWIGKSIRRDTQTDPSGCPNALNRAPSLIHWDGQPHSSGWPPRSIGMGKLIHRIPRFIRISPRKAPSSNETVFFLACSASERATPEKMFQNTLAEWSLRLHTACRAQAVPPGDAWRPSIQHPPESKHQACQNMTKVHPFGMTRVSTTTKSHRRSTQQNPLV